MHFVEQPNNQRILIFDTNIFLLGINFNVIKGLVYTSPRIIEEVSVARYLDKNRNILSRINVAIEIKKLRIKSPSTFYLEQVLAKAKETGDYIALSEADLELIGLALELTEEINSEVILYTNDYTMENLCAQMNITYSPMIKKGIKAKKQWEVFCPVCKRKFGANCTEKYCDVCGVKLKRREKK
ncbi:MAG: hypothetical protein GF383_15620 [Candidatus Lokiarchaeota archaeon]|nr:hypothetical protein [Candidatus Lokiarchaeota archaeon]